MLLISSRLSWIKEGRKIKIKLKLCIIQNLLCDLEHSQKESHFVSHSGSWGSAIAERNLIYLQCVNRWWLGIDPIRQSKTLVWNRLCGLYKKSPKLFFSLVRYNGSLPNGDRGRRKSRFALFKRPKANGVKPSTVHIACTPQAAKVKTKQNKTLNEPGEKLKDFCTCFHIPFKFYTRNFLLFEWKGHWVFKNDKPGIGWKLKENILKGEGRAGALSSI